MLDSRRSGNTTHAWTKSRALCLHLVMHLSLTCNGWTQKLIDLFSKVLHPYYKLAYIKVAWGGPEEQAAEIRHGNLDAKDWQDEARKIIETTVSPSHSLPEL